MSLFLTGYESPKPVILEVVVILVVVIEIEEQLSLYYELFLQSVSPSHTNMKAWPQPGEKKLHHSAVAQMNLYHSLLVAVVG